MKRKHSVGKAVLSLCLAVVLFLQTLTFSAVAFAGSAPDGYGTASVTDAVYGTPDEPSSVPDAVYAMPANFVTMAADLTDKTAVLMGANTPFPLEVIQDGNVLKRGDAIHGRKPFSLKSIDIKVPVKGDAADPNTVDGSTVILYGDYVMLDRATYFPEVILPTATMTLREKSGYTIGTAHLSEAGIRVVFDGEERFFNGQGRNITFGFESTAKADVSDIEYGQQKPIDIFGANYMLDNPSVTPAYSIRMKSNSNASENNWIYAADFVEGAIAWQVDIAATDMFDPAIPQPLDGLKFYNALDPAQVGTYVEGSFKVNGSAVTPESGSTNTLNYTFPAGFGDKAIVTFKTWIPKAKYYTEYNSGNNGYQTVTNTADLRDASDSKLLSANTWRVAFKPDWIQKSGTLDKRSSSTDPRTMTWTIDVNKNYSKQGLKDFTITDALPTGLTWKSAAWQSWDIAKKDWSAATTPITPDANNVYSFGEVNAPIRLVIVSEVTGSTTGFTNKATAQWKLDVNTVQNNDQASVWDTAVVTIGAHTLTKSVGSGETLSLGTLPWKVTLTPQEALPDGAVYDLLVYGDASSIDFTKITASPTLDAGILNQLKGNSRENYYQRFQSGSFQSSDGLTHQIYTLSQDGKPVADLLQVSGYNTDKPATFTYTSLMTQWEHFAGNRSTDHYNRATLFEGTTRTIDSTRPAIRFNGGMFAKEMLFASTPEGTSLSPTNVNHYIRNDANDAYTLAAYDQVTKTVTFRLSFNMNGLRTEEMAKDGGNHVASDIRLVDTLPEGWEFVPYSEGQDFAIYKGARADYGATVSATTLISDPSDLVSFSAAGNIGTFSFTKLESPYVVLVKARPSEETLRQYFDTGESRQEVTNTAEMKITWGDEPTTVTATRKVIVPMQSLSKSVTKPNSGVLEWTVNYTPPFEIKDGVYLQDTLGEGLALRKDEKGDLSLRRPDMAVYRAKLTPSGGLTKDGDALNLYDPNSEVKVDSVTEGGTTRLMFRMTNPNQLYQFVYQTEVTEVPSGGKVGNEIKLMGDDTLKNIGARSEHSVDSSDVGGSAETQGKLDLLKVDPKGKPLGGVEFTLYESDGVTEVTGGTTGPDGKLSLFAKAGLYVLKQTYIDPITYLPTTTVYQVRVASTPWNPIWVDGVEVTSEKPLVVPTPVWVPGNVTLDTAIEGKGADPDKEFEYTITFSNGQSYAYSGSISGTVVSGGTVTLRGGQAITIKDIPDGITYTIVQKDYASEGYTTDPVSLARSGSIVAEETATAKFVNAKYLPGKLTIGQTVTGNGADKEKAFEFTVTFEGAGVGKTYTYTTSEGTTGTIGSGGKISLKDGETAVIVGIPKDTTYTVTQTDYTTDGYTTTWPDWQTIGIIAEEGDHKEEVVNTRMVYGGLLIGQTVEGSGADKDKLFEFTVQFPDAASNESYRYTKSDGTVGTIRSGETITLKHGQTVAIDVPSGNSYIVTQTDYTGEDYTADPVDRTHSGTIVEKQIAEARFVNAKYLPGQLTLTPDPAVVPGNGTTPSQLTATLTDHEGKPVADTEVIFTLPDNTEVKAKTDMQGKAVISYTPPKLDTTTPEDHLITAKVDSPTEGKLTADTKVTTVPAAIFGVLRDNETGEVIPNATIVITDKTNGKEQEITTDADGAYFHPVLYGGDYTISYTKQVKVNGVDQPITFTQKAQVAGDVKGGELVPAHITAVGVVLLKQSDGQSSLLNSELAGKMRIYLRNASGEYVTENGAPKAFDLQPNGAFSAEGLSAEKYKMEVRYEVAPGKELTIQKAELDVKANGELNISQELVDPYGTVYDANKGITTGQIEGATVTLYYADTERNRLKGIDPGTKVTLPPVPGFPPHDNKSPEQDSDAAGFYAYMVFPETDYYLVVTKPGYETYTSETISVDFEIVKHNVPMKPISSGGGGGGTVPVNPDPDPANPGTEPSKPEPENPVPGGGNGGTDNGNGGSNNGNGGSNNGDSGTDNDNVGTDNDNVGTDNDNVGTDNDNVGTDNDNVGTDNDNVGTDNDNVGTDNDNVGADNDSVGADNDSVGADNGNVGTNNGNVGTDSGNVGADTNNVATGNVSNELDDVPATGDSSVSPIFYMVLALMSLITIGFCLLSGKRKNHIQ